LTTTLLVGIGSREHRHDHDGSAKRKSPEPPNITWAGENDVTGRI